MKKPKQEEEGWRYGRIKTCPLQPKGHKEFIQQKAVYT